MKKTQIEILADRIAEIERNNDGQRHIDIERDLRDLYNMVNILWKDQAIKEKE